MLHTKSQDHRPSGSREEDFEMVLPYMGVAVILVMSPKYFVYIFTNLSKKSLHMKFEFNLANGFVRKLCFNTLMGLQYERPMMKGQRSTLTFGTYS